MNPAILVLIGSQVLFTCSDLLARSQMPKQGFALTTFLSGWFVVYVMLRCVATFGQLYVLTAVELGKSMALFGAASIILANVLGLLVLREVLSPLTSVGISLAVVAFLLIAAGK